MKLPCSPFSTMCMAPDQLTRDQVHDALAPVIEDAGLRQLFGYWLDLRSDHLVPDRADFQPENVTQSLANFWIIKRDPERNRYVFTLAAEKIRLLMGQTVIGQSIEQVFGEQAESLNQEINKVLSLPALHHMKGQFYRTDRSPLAVERLALPMATHGVVDTVYGATVFEYPKRHVLDGASYTPTVPVTLVPLVTQGSASPLKCDQISELITDSGIKVSPPFCCRHWPTPTTAAPNEATQPNWRQALRD